MIPAIQWRAAVDLGGSHGHGWAYWADGTDDRHYRGEAAYDAALGGRDVYGEFSQELSDEEYARKQAIGTAARNAVWSEPLVYVQAPESWEQATTMYLDHCARYDIRPGLSPSWGHVTATWRLAWVVDTDGRVDISVSRPRGIVIRATVRTRLTSEDYLVGDIVSLTTHGPYGERHIDALMRAVLAVTLWEPYDRQCWTPDDRKHEELVVARLRAMPGYDDVITEVAS